MTEHREPQDRVPRDRVPPEKWRQLPERVRPDDYVETAPEKGPAGSPEPVLDVEREFLIRYGAG